MHVNIPAFYFFCQIAYKKGLTEQQTQFTSLPDPPDLEFAKKVTNQVSKVSAERWTSPVSLKNPADGGELQEETQTLRVLLRMPCPHQKTLTPKAAHVLIA